MTTIKTVFADRLYNSAAAAKYLASLLCDGRNYVALLDDQRRGRRTYCIPFERGLNNEVLYRKSDLLEFVVEERAKGVATRRVRLAMEYSALKMGSMLPRRYGPTNAAPCRAQDEDLDAILARLA